MLGFFLVEIPRKRGSKTSKLFFFFFTFSFFLILFFNVFAPLRTFDDFVALKRVLPSSRGYCSRQGSLSFK